MEGAAVEQVTCPTCGAQPGVGCSRRGGGKAPVHGRRLTAFVASEVKFGTGPSRLPRCDTDEADGRLVDRGMAHGNLEVIAEGTYTDTVRCTRCKREFPVAAKS